MGVASLMTPELTSNATGYYPYILPRIVGCKKCGKKFTLKKRQMWFHCGIALILLVKESQELQVK